MALDGAKFICLPDTAAADVAETTPAAVATGDVAGNSATASLPENVIEAKGRKFTVGYYMNCDYVLEDQRAIGVHCEIQCDAFGRVTIHNNCEEYPISVNDQIITLKRPLLDGSRIKILDRNFLWKFPKSEEGPTTSNNKAGKNLASDETNSTPQKLIGVPEQAPNSCPDLKPHRKMDKRFTVHNFAYCINFDEEDNTSSELENMNESENVGPEVSGEANTQKKPDETGETSPKNILPENNSTIDSTKEKAAVETGCTERRSVTPEPQTCEPTIASTPLIKFEYTPKINLINCTKNKGNASTEKKKRLLTLCQQSDIVITSFSPRETGVRVEKSFTAIFKPSAACTLASTSATPKSVYSTPKSMLSDFSDDGSRDFIDFTTPATSKKSARPIARNSSMHLIDLTTPNKLAPASPRPAPALKTNRTLPSHVKLSTTPLSSAKLVEGTEKKKDIGMQLKTPIVEVSLNKAGETPQSAASVISVDGSTDSSSAVIDISTEDSGTPNTSSSTCKGVVPKTPMRGVGQKPLTSTPLRTPQSLMKRAILTSAKKQVNSSMRLAVNKATPIRETPSTTAKLEIGNTAAGSSPLASKSPISIGSPGSVAAAQRRNINTSTRRSFSTAGITSTPTGALQTRKIPASASRLGVVKRTSPLRGVRKSFGGTTLSSHISKTRRSVLPTRKHSPTAIATKLVSKARKSFVATSANNTPIASRGRSLVAAAVSGQDKTINPIMADSATPLNKSAIDITAKNEEEDTSSLVSPNSSNELSRTFTVDDSLEEVQVECVNETVADTSSSQKQELNKTFSPDKSSLIARVAEEESNKSTEHISESFAEVVEANEKGENDKSTAGTVTSKLALQQEDDGPVETSVSDSEPDKKAQKPPNTQQNKPVENDGEQDTRTPSDQVIETLDAGEISDNDVKEPLDSKDTEILQVASLSSEILEMHVEPQEESATDSITGKQAIEVPNIPQNNSTWEIEDKERANIVKNEIDETLNADEINGTTVVAPTENNAEETPTTSEGFDADEGSKPSGESQGTAELLQEIEYVLNKSDELQQQLGRDHNTTDTYDELTDKTKETAADVNITEKDKDKTSEEKEISESENKGSMSPSAPLLEEPSTSSKLAYSETAEVEDTISLESNILQTTSEIALSDLETGSTDTEITSITSMATLNEPDVSAVESNSDDKSVLSEAAIMGKPDSTIDTEDISTVKEKVPVSGDIIDSKKLELLVTSKSEADIITESPEANLRYIAAVSEADTVSMNTNDLLNDEIEIKSTAEQKDNESNRKSEVIESLINSQASVTEKEIEVIAVNLPVVSTQVNSAGLQINSPLPQAQPIELETAEPEKYFSEESKTKGTLIGTGIAEKVVKETVRTESSTLGSEQIQIENENTIAEVEAANVTTSEPQTSNLSDILNTPKPVENSSTIFGLHNLMDTPKASTSAEAAKAALKDNSASVKTLLKIKMDTPHQTAEGSTFTPRRSARRRASANPVLTPTPSHSVTPTLKTATDTDTNDTPRRTTRRRASASAEITYTPQRVTRRRSSLSLDNEEAVAKCLTPVKRGGLRLKRATDCPIAEDMGAIIEEESKESADVPQAQVESDNKPESEAVESKADALSIPKVIEESICEEVSTHRQHVEENIENIVSKYVDKETKNEENQTKQVDDTNTTERSKANVQNAKTQIEEKMETKSEKQTKVQNDDDSNIEIVGEVLKAEILLGSEGLATEIPNKTGDIHDQSDYEYGKEVGEVAAVYGDQPETPERKGKTVQIADTHIDKPKTPVMVGMRELLTTPKVDEKTPKLIGVRDLMRTPKTTVVATTIELVDDEQRFTGLTELMKTPKAATLDEKVALGEEEVPTTSLKSRSEFIGMRELLKTPKHTSTPYYSGIREMLRTPKACSTPHLGGVEELMQTPKRTKLIEESEDKNEELDQFFKTPRAKNVMIPADPASAVLEPSSGSSEDIMNATTEYDLHSSSQRPLEDIYKTPVSRLTSTTMDEDIERKESEIKIRKDESLAGTLREGEIIVPETPAPNVEDPTKSTTISKQNLSAEEAFDEMVGLRTSLDETPPRKVYVRKQQTINAAEAALSPFSAADVISDLPKTDIQEWVDNLDQGTQLEEEEQEFTVSASMLDATKATHDPIAATISDISSISENQDTTEKLLADMSGVSSMADPLLPSTSKSANPLDTVVIEEDETLRPDTPVETDISGINLLDQTTESVFSEALVVSDSESVQDTNENVLEEKRNKEKVEKSIEVVTDDPNKTQEEDFPVMLVDSSDSEPEEDLKADNINIKPAEENAPLESTGQIQDAEVIEIDDSITTSSAESTSKDSTVSKANDIHEEFINFQAHKSIAGQHVRASTPNRSSMARITEFTRDRRQSMGAEQQISKVSINLTVEKSRLLKEKADQGGEVIDTVVEVDEDPTDETCSLDNLSMKDEKTVATPENGDKSTLLLSEFCNFSAHQTIAVREMRASTPDQVNKSLTKRIPQSRRQTLGAEQHLSDVTIDFGEERLKLEQIKQQPAPLEEIDESFHSTTAAAVTDVAPKDDVLLVEKTTGYVDVTDVDMVEKDDIAEDVVESTQPMVGEENLLKLEENMTMMSDTASVKIPNDPETDSVGHIKGELSSTAHIDGNEDSQIIEDSVESSNIVRVENNVENSEATESTVLEDERTTKEGNENTHISSNEDVGVNASTSLDIISTNLAKDEDKSSSNKNAVETEKEIPPKPLKAEDVPVKEVDNIQIIEGVAENVTAVEDTKVDQKIVESAKSETAEVTTAEKSTNVHEENVSDTSEISFGTSGNGPAVQTEISSTTNMVLNDDEKLIENVAGQKLEAPEDTIVEDIALKESNEEEIENQTKTIDSPPDETDTGNELNESDIFDLTEDLPVINTTQGIILDLTEEDEDESSEYRNNDETPQEKKAAEDDKTEIISRPATESPHNTNTINNTLEGQITSSVQAGAPTATTAAEETTLESKDASVDNVGVLPTESGVVEEMEGTKIDSIQEPTLDTTISTGNESFTLAISKELVEDSAERETSNLAERNAEKVEHEVNTVSMEVPEDKEGANTNKSLQLEAEQEEGKEELASKADELEVIKDTTNEVTNSEKSLYAQDIYGADEVIQTPVEESEYLESEVPILQLQAEEQQEEKEKQAGNSSNVELPEVLHQTIKEEVDSNNKSVASILQIEDSVIELDSDVEEVMEESSIQSATKTQEKEVRVETSVEVGENESTISNKGKEREEKAESEQHISIDLTTPATDSNRAQLNTPDEVNDKVTTANETPIEIPDETVFEDRQGDKETIVENLKTKPLELESKPEENVEPSSSKTPVESDRYSSAQALEQSTSVTKKTSKDISENTEVKATEKEAETQQMPEAGKTLSAIEDQHEQPGKRKARKASETKKTTDSTDHELVSKNILETEVLVEDAADERYKTKCGTETQQEITESVELRNLKERESQGTTSGGIELPAKRRGRKPSKQMTEEKKESTCVSSVPVEAATVEEKPCTNQMGENQIESVTGENLSKVLQEESEQAENTDDTDNTQKPTSSDKMHEPAKRKVRKPSRSKKTEENVESTVKIPIENLPSVEDNNESISTKPDVVVSTSTRKAETEFYAKASYEVRLSEVIEEASNIKNIAPAIPEQPETSMNIESINKEKSELAEEESAQEITSTTGHIEEAESVSTVSKGEEELHAQRQTRRARKGSQSSQCSTHEEDHLPTTTSTRRRGGRRRAETPVEHSADECTASDVSKVKRRRGQVQTTEESRLKDIKEVQTAESELAAGEQQTKTVESKEIIVVNEIIEDTQVSTGLHKNITSGKDIDSNKPTMEEGKLKHEEKEEALENTPTERLTSKRRRVGKVVGELGDGGEKSSSKNSDDPLSDIEEVQNLAAIEITTNVSRGGKRKKTHSESSQTSNLGENTEPHTTQRRRRGRPQTLDEPIPSTTHGTEGMPKANIELIKESQENKDVKSTFESGLPPVNEAPEYESSNATKKCVEDDAVKKEVHTTVLETSKHMRTKRAHKPSEIPKDHTVLTEEINDLKSEPNNEEIIVKHEVALSNKSTAGRARVNRRRKSEVGVDKEAVHKAEETNTDETPKSEPETKSAIDEHDAESPNAVEDSVGGRRGRRGAAAAATVAINEVSSAHKRGALRGKSHQNKSHIAHQAELVKKSVDVEQQDVSEDCKEKADVGEKKPQNVLRKRRGSVTETLQQHTEGESEITEETESSTKIIAKRRRKRRESHHTDEPPSPKKHEANEDAPTSSATTESPAAASTKQRNRRKRKDSHQNTDDAVDSRVEDEPPKKRPQSRKRRDSSLDSSTHDGASVDVDTNIGGNTSSSSTTPQRSRTVPRRAAAAQDRNYDESSDAEAQVDLKRRIEKASLPKTSATSLTAPPKSSKHKSPSASKTPTVELPLTPVIEIATKITGTPVLAAVMTTSRGGRQRKPTARVQQYLEEERAKAETPKKRLLLGSTLGAETPARVTPARRTRKASNVETEVVETVKTPARGRGRNAKTVQVIDVSDESRAHSELETTQSASHGEEADPIVKPTSRRGKDVTATPLPLESELADSSATTAAASKQVTHTGRVGRAAKAAAAAALITDEPSSSHVKARGGRARRGAHAAVEEDQHPDDDTKDTTPEVETPSVELEKQTKKAKTAAATGRVGRGGRRKQQQQQQNIEEQALLVDDETSGSALQSQHHPVVVDADDEHEEDEDTQTHTEEEEAKSHANTKGKKRNAPTRKRVATEHTTTDTSPPKRGRRRAVAATSATAEEDEGTEAVGSGRNRKIVRFDAATPSSVASSAMSVDTPAEEEDAASSAPKKRATRSRRK
ncbi:unnamed protein product [Ceratitis capitata]|uniref:(Mediterranean fruit fly) hypothetical protein n=1 Tax=Ceratitis capitata TaxID=7213 RepID=A0A811UAG4_CERCA|nr:unnamed protein product [Ceratitis capitata]